MPIEVKVLYFGRLRDVVGRAEESAQIPADSSLAQLFVHLSSRHPGISDFRASLVASRNQEFAAWSTPLQSGDEIAFLPPVSGG
ncbi:MAG TPA: molybdopterin converting factor subunit 1 [Candidatus Acidoferrum sp.]|nr:molybdopterin converting factor subunit 1 [Candidatus Acidoferrum sp.]